MAGGVQVSVAMSGSHSVGPGSADRVYVSIEQALPGAAAYRMRSSLPGHEFSREGGEGGIGSISVEIEESSFTVGWTATSAFSAPAAMLDVLGNCIRPSGKVSLHASVAFDRVPAALMDVGRGLFVKRCYMATFELSTPDAAPGMPGADKIPFKAMPVFGGADAGRLPSASQKRPASC
ncbi:MAG: hypothetical protein OXU37_00985 [Thaumarchaeota archaeon]|nr:hypothetical protein [Nitrososphaerota archaeon]